MDLIEPLIQEKHLATYLTNKKLYNNIIFNHALIWEIINDKYLNTPVPIENKHRIYLNILHLPFEKNETVNNSKIGNFHYCTKLLNKSEISLEDLLLSASEVYCSQSDCKSNLLKEANVFKLQEILISLLNC